MPRIDYLQLKGSNPYAGHQPLQARIRKEGTVARPRWYAYVVYAVPADQMRQGAQEGSLGLDRNVGQVTDSDGTVHRRADMSRLDARLKRHQRCLARKQKGSGCRRRIAGQLQKLHRKCRRVRDHDTHHISRKVADTAHTVVIEDLHTQGMPRSAKGTVESPEHNVQAKVGLNRSILASGWGQLERKLAYKGGQLVKVPAAYTSQTCSRCGYVDKVNRTTQARFRCVACQFQLYADHNAAINILGRAALPDQTLQIGPRLCGVYIPAIVGVSSHPHSGALRCGHAPCAPFRYSRGECPQSLGTVHRHTSPPCVHAGVAGST